MPAGASTKTGSVGESTFAPSRVMTLPSARMAERTVLATSTR